MPDRSPQHLAAPDCPEDEIDARNTTDLNGTSTDQEVLCQLHVLSCPTVPESSAAGLVGAETPLALWMSQGLVLTRLGYFEAERKEVH